MCLGFIKIKRWSARTGWKHETEIHENYMATCLHRLKTLGLSFHENKIAKCLHRTKAWGLRFMKQKMSSVCTGWKHAVWTPWNQNVKCLHAEMLASGFLFLRFLGHTGVPETLSTGFYWLQFVPHTPFYWSFSPEAWLKPGCLPRMQTRCLFSFFKFIIAMRYIYMMACQKLCQNIFIVCQGGNHVKKVIFG